MCNARQDLPTTQPNSRALRLQAMVLTRLLRDGSSDRGRGPSCNKSCQFSPRTTFHARFAITWLSDIMQSFSLYPPIDQRQRIAELLDALEVGGVTGRRLRAVLKGDGRRCGRPSRRWEFRGQGSSGAPYLEFRAGWPPTPMTNLGGLCLELLSGKGLESPSLRTWPKHETALGHH